MAENVQEVELVTVDPYLAQQLEDDRQRQALEAQTQAFLKEHRPESDRSELRAQGLY